MRLVLIAAVTAIVMSILLAAPCRSEEASGEKVLTVRVEFPLKTPRSRDPVLGGARDRVYFSVTIPAGVKTVRGAICNPFSKDAPVSRHWLAACRHWQFAYVQTDFDGVKQDEFPLLKTALTELAKLSGHPGVERLPLCFIGMSRGGGMSMQLAELFPDRTIASAPVCLEVGPTTAATRAIPVMTIFGERDGSQMERLLTKLPAARQHDALWAIAPQWNRKHEFGQANNLLFVFFDDVIARRLPITASGATTTGDAKSAALRDTPSSEGWLGFPSTWGKDGRLATVRPAKGLNTKENNGQESAGDASQACWLPSQRVAAVWQAFVSATKDVSISEPAGLGDGQTFVEQSASKPIVVKAALAAQVKPQRVELWDAHERLTERTQGPWTFEVPLKPGIHSLIVVVREADKPRTSRPHTIVVTK